MFSEQDTSLYEECLSKISEVNRLLNPIFNDSVYSVNQNPFGFKNIQENVIFNSFEGQLNTGKMMESLLKLAYKNNIKIVNSTSVLSFCKSREKMDCREAVIMHR